MKIKKCIRAISFLLIFSGLFYYVNCRFTPGDIARNEKASFYMEPKDSIDVIYCGSSSLLRNISPMEIYREEGIISYSLATVLQAPAVTVFTVKEALRYQSPKVLVINMESALQDYRYEEWEAFLHSSLDPFRLSADKLAAIYAVQKNDPDQSAAEYLFPILRYHGAWQELKTFQSQQKYESFRKGYDGLMEAVPVELEENYMSRSGESAKFNEQELGYYINAIKEAKDAGVSVLLVKMPRATWTLEQHQALADFAKNWQVDYLDFNTEEMWARTGLDLEKDFCDPNHLCHSGAVKLSRVMGDYLAEHYELTDARENPAYVSWKEQLSLYDEAYNR